MTAAKKLFTLALDAVSKMDEIDADMSTMCSLIQAISIRSHDFDEHSRTSFARVLGLVVRGCRNSGLCMLDTDELEFLAMILRTGSIEQKKIASRAFFDLVRGRDIHHQALNSVAIVQMYLHPNILFHPDPSLVQTVVRTLVFLSRGEKQIKSAFVDSGALNFMLGLIKDTKAPAKQKIKYFAAKVIWNLVSHEETMRILVQSIDVAFDSLSAASEGTASSISLIAAIFLKLAALHPELLLSYMHLLSENMRNLVVLLQNLPSNQVARTIRLFKSFSAAAKRAPNNSSCCDAVFVYIADIVYSPPRGERAATGLAEIYSRLFPPSDGLEVSLTRMQAKTLLTIIPSIVSSNRDSLERRAKVAADLLKLFEKNGGRCFASISAVGVAALISLANPDSTQTLPPAYRLLCNAAMVLPTALLRESGAIAVISALSADPQRHSRPALEAMRHLAADNARTQSILQDSGWPHALCKLAQNSDKDLGRAATTALAALAHGKDAPVAELLRTGLVHTIASTWIYSNAFCRWVGGALRDLAGGPADCRYAVVDGGGATTLEKIADSEDEYTVVSALEGLCRLAVGGATGWGFVGAPWAAPGSDAERFAAWSRAQAEADAAAVADSTAANAAAEFWSGEVQLSAARSLERIARGRRRDLKLVATGAAWVMIAALRAGPDAAVHSTATEFVWTLAQGQPLCRSVPIWFRTGDLGTSWREGLKI